MNFYKMDIEDIIKYYQKEMNKIINNKRLSRLLKLEDYIISKKGKKIMLLINGGFYENRTTKRAI